MAKLVDKLKLIIKGSAKQGQPLWEETGETAPRELHFFADTFRVGMLTYFDSLETHDLVMKYKRDLDQLGYETEVLMYVEAKEVARNIFLPTVTLNDLDKQGRPYTPRTDRFVKKKFDILLNLYFNDCAQLKYLAKLSIAKCRVGAMRPHLMDINDCFVYTQEQDNLPELINSINDVLNKQAYVRKV